jgi:hypothetical protein
MLNHFSKLCQSSGMFQYSHKDSRPLAYKSWTTGTCSHCYHGSLDVVFWPWTGFDLISSLWYFWTCSQNSWMLVEVNSGFTSIMSMVSRRLCLISTVGTTYNIKTELREILVQIGFTTHLLTHSRLLVDLWM